MASDPVELARPPQDQYASSARSKKIEWRFRHFIVGLVFFATIHFLLQRSPRLDMQTKVIVPAPSAPHIHRKDTSIQPHISSRTPRLATTSMPDCVPASNASCVHQSDGRSRTPRPAKVYAPASVATSNVSWIFNAEEIRKVRNATAILHPDVRLQTHTLGNCQKKARRRRRSCQPAPFNHTVGNHTTCAVVGNSGILLGSHCGAEIDSKDYVIRMDVPAIRGFETDVGRKTNMTILNVSTPKRIRDSSGLENRTQDVYESRLRDINGTVLVAGARERVVLKAAMTKYDNQFSFILLTCKESFKFAPFIHRIASAVSRRYRTPGPPSTGQTTVLTATAFCDQLHLYGFFPFQRDENKRPVPYHYYPDDYIEPIIQSTRHNMGKEYRFYEHLQKRRVLKLHVGKCGIH
ncbi:CMP-N-acetylneuraminate-poly-alpha-2,8-sialyltransferase-like [Branchiostoma floridae]|uniref:CMP-N-acetylneuraminate-poly-alpha-2, 8-sialyltransferase-like n=1 Tax=Branchiostoma floridae TaxID=7739 RepID=A0A9J7LJT3_BRAFL|nr:CMP-N-acetylneuraminate-poly-alpha-2,8-sialyltransferase-like [Branchiostoma floridae]